jgi:hypothetical protein
MLAVQPIQLATWDSSTNHLMLKNPKLRDPSRQSKGGGVDKLLKK